MTPIWQDHIVTLGSSGPYRFRVRYVGENSSDVVVYEGKAYARPGETAVKVRVNDIAADVLSRRMEILRPVIDNDPTDLPSIIPISFYTDVWDELTQDWDAKAMVQFAPDWSYNALFDESVDEYSVPINGRVDPNQLVFFSLKTPGSVTVKRYKSDGSHSNQTVAMTDSYTNDMELDAITNGAGTVILDMANYYPLYVKLVVEGVTYDIVTGCGNRYALYYVNAFGGWDSFLIEGLTDVSDAQGRMVHAKEYDNNDSSARGRAVTVNELTRQYTFRTGWMTDAESSRMHHLLNSPDVYVHDMMTGDIHPLILTGSETRYKTFRNNGRKLIEYTITAQLAQDRIRR